MIASSLPILIIDVFGSVAMVIIALMALYKAKTLRNMDKDNSVYLYLLWITTGFSIFALSRSFAHILKQFLIISENPDIWSSISPYTGSINTASFMLVGLISLFFHQNWTINEKILSGRRKLEETHIKLMHLNQTLENKVVERTERLTSSEHKCRRIFEQSLDTIIMTDNEFKVIETNKAGIELMGYSQDEMVMGNLSIGDFFVSHRDWERIRDKINTHEYILNEEAEFLRSDHTSVLVLMTGGIDYGAFGCAKIFHFIIKNINDRRQMEQQIAQADKLAAIGELSAGVAHEINNPLGVILGYTQLLLKEPTPFKDDLKIIEKHVKNCKVVVSDLLAFSRKGSAKMEVVDIAQVVNGVIGFLSNHSDFRNIELIVQQVSDVQMDVVGNEQELSQVMINLLINASHAVDGKGSIHITPTRNAHDKIQIHVKDDGKGIEPENLSKIFHPFFTTKSVGQGTGLGLSVGYGIIKRHQGNITVDSTLGAGSVFTITLPAAAASQN